MYIVIAKCDPNNNQARATGFSPNVGREHAVVERWLKQGGLDSAEAFPKNTIYCYVAQNKQAIDYSEHLVPIANKKELFEMLERPAPDIRVVEGIKASPRLR